MENLKGCKRKGEKYKENDKTFLKKYSNRSKKYVLNTWHKQSS